MKIELKCNKIVSFTTLMLLPCLIYASEFSLEECLVKAAEGNAEAQWQLGQRYENGDGIKKNNVRALAQYKKAAEQKHRKACSKLAYFYENGKYVKRDLALAAKYRAWAEGDNGELAAAQIRISVAKSKEDEIEKALDYILGRSGKPKDPKTGIRILYKSAKAKPIAQKVFVDRWCRGDLDEALGVLSDEEWNMILPWYKNAWENGNKRTGLVLGNDAYSRKQYSSAIGYWQGCGTAKCWYFIGRFYDFAFEEGNGGGPLFMQDETKARKAYEKCLRIDRSWDDARFNLGGLYLFAKKKENENLVEAKNIFSYFLRKDSNHKWYNYCYGRAGYGVLLSKFHKKWPRPRVEKLFALAEGYLRYNNPIMADGTDLFKYLEYKGPVRDRKDIKDYNLMIVDFESLERSQREYVDYIRKAARLGCEPAQQFISNLNSKGE